jgi:transcriptional regulator with XRE-family HTH domain
MENNWKAMVLLLREVALDKKITHEQIAEKIGVKKSNVSRVFSLKYCPSMDLFLKISMAIGINFFFEDKEDKSDLNVCFERAIEELGRRLSNERLKSNIYNNSK